MLFSAYQLGENMNKNLTDNLTDKLRMLWETAQKELDINFINGSKNLTVVQLISTMAEPIPAEIQPIIKETYVLGANKGIEFAERALEAGDYLSAREAIQKAGEYTHLAGQPIPPKVPELLRKAGVLGLEQELKKARSALHNALHSDASIACRLWNYHLDAAASFAEKADINPKQNIHKVMKEEFPLLSQKLVECAEYVLDNHGPADDIMDTLYAYARQLDLPVPEKYEELRRRKQSDGKQAYVRVN